MYEKAYLLAYEDDLGTREQLKECFNTGGHVLFWRYDIQNAFYIISCSSAEDIYNHIKKYFNNAGKFIITEISSNSYGWLTKDSWYLIENKKLRE